MAISVEGYGNITKGNAKEIYKAWRAGDIDLNKAQQSKCESFMSPQDFDDVEYDSSVTENRGKNAIDREGADKHGKQGGNATGTSAGMAAGAAGLLACCKTAVGYVLSDGWTAAAYGAMVLASGAGALVMAKLFDNGYKDRTAARDAAGDSNAQLDTYNETLANTMEMMNEDVEHYNETQNELTTTVNTQVSQGADLQMQLDTALAVGDTDKVQQLREELKMLKEADNSELEDELSETGAGLEEYRSLNAESLACADSGQSVSNFLKEGTGLGVVATIDAVLLAAATILAGLCIGGSAIGSTCSFARLDFGGGAAGIAAGIMFGIATGLVGMATKEMISKAKGEFECGSAGGEMQSHVDDLMDMADQQKEYTSDTESQYANSDEAAAESKGQAEAKASKTVATNKEELGDNAKEEDAEPAIL